MRYGAIIVAAMLVAGMMVLIPEGPSEIVQADYTPSVPIRINDDTELAAIASSGAGTPADPYIVDEYEIDGTGEGYCMYIANTTMHWQIEDCNLTSATGTASYPYWPLCALVIFNVTGGNITNVNCSNSWNYGIYVNGSYGLNFTYNRITGNGLRGMSFENVSHDMLIDTNWINGTAANVTGTGITVTDEGTNFDITNNYFTLCSNGIAIEDTESCDVTDNYINTGVTGVVLTDVNSFIIDGNHLVDPPIGIYLSSAWSSSVTNNDFDYHANYCLVLLGCYDMDVITNTFRAADAGQKNAYGIFVTGSYNNTFYDNSITECDDYGAYVDVDSYNNTFSDNTFSDNDGVNAYVEGGTSNVFDNGTKGNWWDDYTGYDSDGDGIGETPYNIDIGTFDNYPQTLVSGGSTAGTIPTPGITPDTTVVPVDSTLGDILSDISLGWMFWVGGIILLLGLAKFPIPYISTYITPKMLLIGGVILIVWNFL